MQTFPFYLHSDLFMLYISVSCDHTVGTGSDSDESSKYTLSSKRETEASAAFLMELILPS
jgi:hypothetical protein